MYDPSSTLLENHPDLIARRLMQRAYNRDGLPEIATGLCFLLSSALIYAQVILPPKSPGFIAACLGYAVVMPALALGLPRALRYVRTRYLIARAGYVKTKPVALKTIIAGIAIAAVFTILVFGIIPRFAHPDRWLLAGSGLFSGVLASVCGRSPRFVVLGVVICAAGIAVALSGSSPGAGFAILWGVAGIAVLVSGSIVFARFMRMPTESGD